MKNEDKIPEPEAENEPQVFKPEKEEGRWTFSRRDFLKLAIAGTVAALLPRAKDVLGRHVQLVAHATELAQQSLQPGQPLTKVWYLKNNSTQSWGEGAVLSLVGAAAWQAVSSISLPNLAPGGVIPVRVSMVAPVDLDPRPVEASVEITDGLFNFFLPIIHKSPEEAPCTCESYTPPCTCESYTPPCTCEYDIPCTCDYYFCPCDYEVPCTCDYHICPCEYDIPCTCEFDFPCGCDGYVPCTCDSYVPCGCVGYVPCSCDYYSCGCVGYVPCGCDFFFPSQV